MRQPIKLIEMDPIYELKRKCEDMLNKRDGGNDRWSDTRKIEVLEEIVLKMADQIDWITRNLYHF